MPAINVQCLDHVTLVVKDVEASRHFYVTQLGMQDVGRPDFDFPGAWFQAGNQLIHLIGEHDRSGPAGYPDGVIRTNSRQQHFAFMVEDARQAAATAKELGLEIVNDAKERPDGAIQVFVKDPDGHVIEFCSGP